MDTVQKGSQPTQLELFPTEQPLRRKVLVIYETDPDNDDYTNAGDDSTLHRNEDERGMYIGILRRR